MNKTQRLFDKNSYAVTRGHDFVEINGVKWATCNLGAENPEDPGMYFRWGDNKGIYRADHEIYKEKFSNDYDTIVPNTRSWNADPVQMLWGGKWRMPTVEEFRKLFHSISFQRKTNYEHSVSIHIGEKKFYIPLGGFCDAFFIYAIKEYGCYWTKTAYSHMGAYSANFDGSAIDKSSQLYISKDDKCLGLNIRPVLDV